MAHSARYQKWLLFVRNASVIAALLIPVVEFIGDVVGLVKPMFP